MAQKTILILGGYGNTGHALTQLLLQETSCRLILAGRDGERARRVADDWNDRFPGSRVEGAFADASQQASLEQLLKDAHVLVAASSTAEYVGQVATAALNARVDYMDPQFSHAKLEVLRSMASAIEATGCCFVSDAGFHPGLPAVLVRCAEAEFDQLRSARVGSVIKIDWGSLDLSDATLREFTAELMDFEALHFREGSWQKAGWLAMMKPSYMHFGRGFGRQYCLPMFLEELRPLPDMFPDLQETGFYVGGFNWFVDWLVVPLGMSLLRIWPDRALMPVADLMYWGLRRFSRPPYGTMLKLEARGLQGGEQKSLELTVYHMDGYALTAAPMAACLLQLLDGSARKPGLWLQGLLVDPERLLWDMQRMGVEVTRV